MDRLEAMSVLLAVIDAGSLSAAGRRLGKPLTTVSRKISELEDRLNVRLINRSGRRLTLTDAGRSYVDACRRILDDVREAERSASGEYSEPKGDLVVAAPRGGFGRLHMIPLVADFLKTYPGINVQLVLDDRTISLAQEMVDVAFRVGNLPDSSLVAIRVGSSRRLVCGSPAYFADRGVPEVPSDLSIHDCVTYGGLMSPTAWTFRRGESEIVVPIQSRLVVNAAESAVDAAIAGVGVTCASSFSTATARQSGALRVVLENFEMKPTPINLLYAAGRFMPQKLRAFCDFATPRLKETFSNGLA
jgi:DNA-binding transcriptional LysR family regulator